MALGYVNPDPKATDKFSTTPKVGWIEVTNDTFCPNQIEARLLLKLIALIRDAPKLAIPILETQLLSRTNWDGVIRESDFQYRFLPTRGLTQNHVIERVTVTHTPTGLRAESAALHLSRASNKSVATEKLRDMLKAHKSHNNEKT